MLVSFHGIRSFTKCSVEELDLTKGSLRKLFAAFWKNYRRHTVQIPKSVQRNIFFSFLFRVPLRLLKEVKDQVKSASVAYGI